LLSLNPVRIPFWKFQLSDFCFKTDITFHSDLRFHCSFFSWKVHEISYKRHLTYHR
jgi:hypothetical protein